MLPGSPRYTELSQPFNGRFDRIRPHAIARCSSPNDVAQTLSFIGAERLRSAIRSGGHCFAEHSCTDGIMIDVSGLNTVSVSAGEVRIGAGARLGHIYETLEPLGLTIPGGTCPTVGIAGLTLGGGLGILGRSYGITSDRLIRAEIVLADGRTLNCDAEHHSDLYWAVQGAGANGFGVVTSLTFDPVTIPEASVNIHARWPLAQAGAVIDGWQHWAPTATNRLAASLKVTLPAQLQQPVRVDLYATLLGDTGEAEHLLRQLCDRAHAEPESVTLTPTSNYFETRRFWATLGTEQISDATLTSAAARPERLYATAEFFRHPLPVRVIDRLLAAVLEERTWAQFRELDFMPWKGAYAHRRPHETAFVHRDERFLLKQSISIPLDASPNLQATSARRLDAISATTRSAESKRCFQNFADPNLSDWAQAYFGDNYQRLVQVKARYDPGNVFRHAQSIPTQ